ncbi:MAG: hypothetical protein U0531_16095 [Dehalococcoidia bacterium]
MTRYVHHDQRHDEDLSVQQLDRFILSGNAGFAHALVLVGGDLPSRRIDHGVALPSRVSLPGA